MIAVAVALKAAEHTQLIPPIDSGRSFQVLIGLGLILFALLSEPADDPDPGAAIEPGEMQERLSAYPHSVLPNDWVDRVRRGDGARRSGVAEG